VAARVISADKICVLPREFWLVASLGPLDRGDEDLPVGNPGLRRCRASDAKLARDFGGEIRAERIRETTENAQRLDGVCIASSCLAASGVLPCT